MFMHLTLVPFLKSAGELKTKPTQHSVKELQSVGIQPDMILCRCEQDIPPTNAERLGFLQRAGRQCDQRAGRRHDLRSAHLLSRTGLDRQLTRHFRLEDERSVGNGLDLSRWDQIVDRVKNPEGEVTIAVVGKYTNLLDL